jgi:type II secretory pathway pseudopilin PulG
MERGFTFLDLVCALTIVGAVLSAAVYYGRPTPSLRTETLELARELDSLSLVSQRQNTPIHGSVAGRSVVFTTAQNTVHRRQIPRGVAVTVLAGKKNIITLYPTGAASPGTVRLSRAGEVCVITQALRGARTVRCNGEVVPP